jgi:predicted O-linked N-acetylglucosamine transferase (SPINDLY family)
MSDTATSELQSALKLHQAGQIIKAARAYQRILDSSPNDPQALHLLGITFIQTAQPAKGAELITRAIALQPNIGTFHLNLASAYQAQKMIDESIAEAEKAIALDPALAGRGYHIAGLAFLEGGQFEDAAYCFEKSIEADPNAAEPHLLLAISVDRLGRYHDGAVAYEKALRLANEMVAQNPSDGRAHALLARIHQQAGRIDESVAAFRTATRLLPDDPTVFYALGQVLQFQGKRDDALTCFQLALRMNPNFADAHIAVGIILDRQYRPYEAITSFKTALALSPHHSYAQGNLAAALTHCGQIDEAIEAGREAIRLNPGSPALYSTLLLTMHYSGKVTPQQLFDEHVEFNRRFGEKLSSSIEPHTNDRDPDRMLRIGFLSGDFKQHPVSKFILPVMQNHDRSKFKYLCYSETEITDDVSKQIQASCDGWRRIVSWSDPRLAAQIREDKIDILIDLSGHTGQDRLLTLARKPAPIQMTHFGYPDTTGLTTVDYRITDALSDPPGQTEQWSTEKLARLPRVAYCYRPVEDVPRIEVRKKTDPIVFGSVNNIAKLSPETLTTWARILKESPDSRLTVLERRHSSKFLDLFNLFDIALDPFPYNGGVTTCDALWMGVPVITLAGQTYVSRQGVSLLTHVGLPDLIAQTPDDYVTIARQLANSRDQLAHLRAHLREAMMSSPLCDYAGYTRELEMFYRTAWREYCEKG